MPLRISDRFRFSALRVALGKVTWSEILLAFLLGRTVVAGNLSPFGPAVYAASRSQGRRYSAACGIAALIGCATSRRWDLLGIQALAMALITFLIRDEDALEGKVQTARQKRSSLDSILAGAIVAASGALVASYQGGGLYAYIGALFQGLCAMVTVRLVSLAFPGDAVQATGGQAEALLVVILLSVGGLQGVEPMGISFARLVAMACTVTAAYIGGPGIGAIAGLAGGLMVSLTGSEDPIILGLLGVAGLLAGMGSWFGKAETAVGFMSAGMLLSFYGRSANIGQRFAEQTVACFGLMLLTPGVMGFLSERFPVLKKEERPQRLVRHQVEPVKLRMAAVSHCLTEIGEMFRQAAAESQGALKEKNPVENNAPLVSGIAAPIRFAVARVCLECPEKAACWEDEFGQTFDLVSELARKMDVLGEVTQEDRDGSLAARCERFGELVSVMSHRKEVERLERRVLAATVETKEALSFQYRCLGQLLSPAVEGRRSLPHAGRSRDGRLEVTLKGGTIPAEGASKAGDLWARYDLGEERSLVVLVDGMGKGEVAARQSKSTIELLRSLLNCGLDLDSCVSFLNSALFTALNPDSFVAMDCLLIDGRTERAYFHKLGSPPSFVRKRSGNVLVVRGSRPPAGAFGSLPCFSTSEPVSAGDAIFLVSDGVFRSSPVPARAEQMIVSRLRRLKDDSIDSLVRAIISHGERYYGRTPPDDVTVVVAKIQGA